MVGSIGWEKIKGRGMWKKKKERKKKKKKYGVRSWKVWKEGFEMYAY